MKRATILAYTTWSVAALLWLATACADRAGFRINHTPSLPVGLWRITPLQSPLARGEIVRFCPPDTAIMREARARGFLGRGRCAGDFEPMLKPVIAVAGDIIRLRPEGIEVNGLQIADSRRLQVDGAGRLIPGIPVGRYIVGADEFWALSIWNASSFDSRYFGAVPRANVVGKATCRLPYWATSVGGCAASLDIRCLSHCRLGQRRKAKRALPVLGLTGSPRQHPAPRM
jgi:conjugative transfer signal peptidase TraF